MDLSKQDREVNNTAGTVAREGGQLESDASPGLWALVGIISSSRGSHDN